MDFLQYYDLESYLLNSVRPRFMQQGYLSAADFFCIVIWKSSRAKSKIAKRLRRCAHADLETTVQALTRGLSGQAGDKDRMRYLLNEWGFRLPTASAILTVLYPHDFTIYDVRVCTTLGHFHELKNLGSFDRMWEGYQDFKRAVEESAPSHLVLRDKDRYLWGKSFYEQLMKDLDTCFNTE